MSPAVALSLTPAGRVVRSEPSGTLAAHAFVLRTAAATDAEAIHALVTDYRGEGHLLPRSLDEIRVHAHRFVVAAADSRIVGCADLARLSRTVAEVRSLVVAATARRAGVGRELIDDVVRRAGRAGFEKLCAFTHAPSYFVELGFSIVPHGWLPEKIEADCRSCAEFRRCGQYAVMLPLVRPRQSCVPLASLHG
jgi:amino-acid N-acetyltransferase